MEKKIKLSELIAKTEQKLKCFDYAEKSMINYHYIGFRPIERYYESRGFVYYSPDSINKFLVQSFNRFGTKKRNRFIMIRKAATLLNEFYETGTLKWKRLPNWGYVPLLPYFEKLMSDFSLYMSKDCQYSSSATIGYKGRCHHFLSFLEQNGHVDLSRITLKDVSDFLPVIAPKYAKSMDQILTSLRCLGHFLNEKKLSSIDITIALIGAAAPRRKLQLGFTQEEAEKIIAVIDRSTLRGKRDYAALLLAKNTGLRCIDLINLKLNEIDWRNRQIRLVQTKTGVPLTLPIEAEVENALADYILNARPSVDGPFVFIRLCKPFIKITTGCLAYILKHYMKAAGMEAHTRMHAFRKGLGTQMLALEIPLPTISNILGHTNIDSAKPYLATNLKQLQACAIGLTDIPVSVEALQ